MKLQPPPPVPVEFAAPASVAVPARRMRLVRAFAVVSHIAMTLLVAGYFAFMLMVLILRYAILPDINEYRPKIESEVSRALGKVVTIETIAADWDGLRPELTLRNVIVNDANGQPSVRLPTVVASVAWESLVVAQIRFHALRIIDANLAIRRSLAGKMYVGGIELDDSGPSDGSARDWLFSQHEIDIDNATLTWNDELRRAQVLGLEHVRVVLRKSGVRHRFAVSATPPADLAAPLDIRGYFDHGIFERPAASDRWTGQVYMAIGFVDLAAWHQYIDYPFDLAEGQGALRAWLGFGAAPASGQALDRISTITADVRMGGVQTRLSKDLPQLGLNSVTGRIGLVHDPRHDQLALSNFGFSTSDGLAFSSTTLTASREFDAIHNPVSGTLLTDRLNLEALASLAERLPFSADVRKVLARYQPKGTLGDVKFDWQGDLQAPQSYSIKSRFSGLTVAAQAGEGRAAGQPGFVNLSGTIAASQSGGSLSISSDGAGALTFPGVFEEPTIPFTRLEANANWTQSAGNLEVHVPKLSVENADLAGTITALYRHGPGSGSSGPGYIDMQGKLVRADGRRVVRYLPTTMPEDLRHYLSRAIQSGASDDTHFTVRGALERFPFRRDPGVPIPSRLTDTINAIGSAAGTRDPGEFHVEARLHGVGFDFAPPASPAAPAVANANRNAPTKPANGMRSGTPSPAAEPPKSERWPTLDDIDGVLVFDRTRMEISARTLSIFNVHFEKVQAVLDDLDDPHHVLHVNGAGSGPLQDVVRFVNGSPVAGWIDQFTDETHATGEARVELKLDLPLDDLDKTRVSGALGFQNNDVIISSAIPKISRASGRLEFSDEGFALHNITGQFLGGPMKMEGVTRADHVTEIRGDGTANLALLRRSGDVPFMQRVSSKIDGTTHYTLAINVADRGADAHALESRGPPILVESNLSGITIDLPAPLHKAAADVMPLRIEAVTPPGPKNDDVELTQVRIGQGMTALFERRRDAKGVMQNSHTAYGVNEPAQLTSAVANANITLKTLDADAWQIALDQLFIVPAGAPAAGPDDGTVYIPNAISARIADLRWAGKSISNVTLNAHHEGPAWQATIDAEQVAGAITWRDTGNTTQIGPEQNRVSARLTRLKIPTDAATDVNSLLDSSPAEIPALDIIADNFELHDKKLGHLELLAVNESINGRREWNMQKLIISNPDANLDAKAVWGPDASAHGDPRTRMSFTMKTTDIGHLMDRMGLPGTIKAGEATMAGEVNWHGSPVSLDYATLNGDLTLSATKGQFLKADPGIAKLLGVLSLQALPRRISLDFSDVFSEGFAFDAIEAKAQIKDGVASTNNFKMRGVLATVLMDGSADITHETQNLRVLVLPEVNAGTGSLAYALLANPAVGLAAFVAQAVLHDPISRAFSREYNVSGSWAEPTVTQIESSGSASLLKRLDALKKTAPSAASGPAVAPSTP